MRMVYVDGMNQAFGRMVMCHMMADTTDELMEMADKIGVNRKWIQYPNTSHEHFDVCKRKKEKAIKLGAKQINRKELCDLLNAKKCDNTEALKVV